MHHTIDALLTWEAMEGQACGEGCAKALGSGVNAGHLLFESWRLSHMFWVHLQASGPEALPIRALGTEVGPFAKGRCGVKDAVLNQESET